MRQFVELLKTPAFLEKVVLLLATVAFTGILGPEILARFSESHFRQQKVFESELQRQHDILSAQSELLKSLSKLTWEFQLLNIDVSFYKTNKNEAAYQKAVEKYQDRSAELLGQIRAELSSSRRLVSPLMQDKLSGLYFGTLLPIDASLERLIQLGASAPDEAWNRQHDDSFFAAQKSIDDVLSDLAREVKLAAPEAGVKRANSR